MFGKPEQICEPTVGVQRQSVAIGWRVAVIYIKSGRVLPGRANRDKLKKSRRFR